MSANPDPRRIMPLPISPSGPSTRLLLCEWTNPIKSIKTFVPSHTGGLTILPGWRLTVSDIEDMLFCRLYVVLLLFYVTDDLATTSDTMMDEPVFKDCLYTIKHTVPDKDWCVCLCRSVNQCSHWMDVL